MPGTAPRESRAVLFVTDCMPAHADPWCPGGVGPRCPCVGAGMPYPMVSWKAANFTFSADSPQGFTHYEYSQTSSARLCTKEGFAKGDTINEEYISINAAREIEAVAKLEEVYLETERLFRLGLETDNEYWALIDSLLTAKKGIWARSIAEE